jgi:uncharacterized membrane protein
LVLLALVSGLVGLLAVSSSIDDSGLIDPLFALACHQNPDRCLEWSGRPMALCARCFAIFVGLGIGAVGALVWPLARRSALILLATAACVTLVDVTIETIGFYANLIPVRMLIGLFLGMAIAWIIGFRDGSFSLPNPNPQTT